MSSETEEQEHRAAEQAAWEAEQTVYEAEVRRLEDEARDARDRELTSWAPVNIDTILANGARPLLPTVLTRQDEQPLLYRGRTNSFVGETESGKTLGAYLTCAQELLEGNGVVYVDFEGEASDFVRWMLALGVPAETISQKARYIHPEDAMDNAGKLAVRRACMAVEPTLVVFDGVTEAMMLHDLNDNATTDTAKFMQMLPKRFQKYNVAVLLIDHTPHGGNRATGSQHKRSSVTGSSFLFIRRAPLVKGTLARSTSRSSRIAPERSDRTQRRASVPES